MMTGQTATFCHHVYAWDQNNALGSSIRPENNVSFLYAQGFIMGEYGNTAMMMI